MKPDVEFPSNYIERYLKMKKAGSHVKTTKKGTSSYKEYNDDNLWNDELLDDIHDISSNIIEYANVEKNLKEKPYYGKKIVSIDIETTSFIPKAREGFVNILENKVCIATWRDKSEDITKVGIY